MAEGFMVGFCAHLVALSALAAQPAVFIDSPPQNSNFPEFSSVTIKVRVENGDGSLRWFADNAGDYNDLLVGMYVATNATVEVPLNNLAPGNYNIAVGTGDGAGGLVYTNVVFTITHAERSITRFTLIALPDATNTTPARINNKGQVVGVSGGKAFLYDGQTRWLGTLGGAYSEATAINDNGQVIGVSDDGEGIRRPFLWEDGKGMKPMAATGRPTDINNKGDVIGSNDQGSFLVRNGVSSVIPGGVADLNNNGYYVGGTVYDSEVHPTWNEFLRINRPVFGEDGQDIKPLAINDSNEVTGTDYSGVGGSRYANIHIFRYLAFRRVRISPNGSMSSPHAINRHGDIVGSSSQVTYNQRGGVEDILPPHAFFAPREGFKLVNELISNRGDFDVVDAVSINDRREIVAVAKLNGIAHGIMLRPNPEFQSVTVDAVTGKLKVSVNGLVPTRVRVESSSNLKDWTYESMHDVSETSLPLEWPIQSGSKFLRITPE
jgi:probable HAF family extracellular repeat protein